MIVLEKGKSKFRYAKVKMADLAKSLLSGLSGTLDDYLVLIEVAVELFSRIDATRPNDRYLYCGDQHSFTTLYQCLTEQAPSGVTFNLSTPSKSKVIYVQLSGSSLFKKQCKSVNLGKHISRDLLESKYNTYTLLLNKNKSSHL